MKKIEIQIASGLNLTHTIQPDMRDTSQYYLTHNLRNAESIMVAQAERIAKLELKLDQFCAKPEPGEPIRNGRLFGNLT